MTERRRAAEAVLIALTDGQDKVLLQRRKNTGWMDGWFDLPSGHIEQGESASEAAARELFEEVNLQVSSQELDLFHVSISDAGSNAPYTYFVFRAEQWDGIPELKEPDLAEDLDFYTLASLPEQILPYVKLALGNIATKKVTFSYLGKNGNDKV